MAIEYDEQSVTVGVAHVQYDKGWYWSGSGISMFPGVVESEIPVGGTGNVLNSNDDTAYEQVWMFYNTAGGAEENSFMTWFDPLTLPEGAYITSMTVNYRARRMSTLVPTAPWTLPAGLTYARYPELDVEAIQACPPDRKKKWVTWAEHLSFGVDGYEATWLAEGYFQLVPSYEWQDLHYTFISPQRQFIDEFHPNYNQDLIINTNPYGRMAEFDLNFQFNRDSWRTDIKRGLQEGTFGVYWSAYESKDYGTNPPAERVAGIDLSFASLTIRYTLDNTIWIPNRGFAEILYGTGTVPNDGAINGIWSIKLADNIAYIVWADEATGPQTYGAIVSVDPATLKITAGAKTLIAADYSYDPMPPFKIHDTIIVQPMRQSNSAVDPLVTFLKLSPDKKSFTIINSVIEDTIGPGSRGVGDIANSRGVIMDSARAMWLTTDGNTVTTSLTNLTAPESTFYDDLILGYELFGNLVVTGKGTVWQIDWTAKTFTWIRQLERGINYASSTYFGGVIRGALPNTVDLYYPNSSNQYYVQKNVPIDGSATMPDVQLTGAVASGLYGSLYYKGDHLVRCADNEYIFTFISDWSYPAIVYKGYETTEAYDADGILVRPWVTTALVDIGNNVSIFVFPNSDRSQVTIEAIPMMPFEFDPYSYANGASTYPDGPLWWIP